MWAISNHKMEWEFDIMFSFPNIMLYLKKISLIQMLEGGMLRRIYDDGYISRIRYLNMPGKYVE